MNEIINAYKNRRTNYNLSNKKVVSTKEIKNIIESCVKYVPSAFNIQSAKVVVLFDDEHKKLWDIVMNTLKKIVSRETFLKTQEKIEKSFKSGYCTILYFDDTELTKKLQSD